MKNESYFIKGFPDYRLVRLSESKFCVLSKKKGYWEEIGSDDGTGHIDIHLISEGVKKHTRLHVIVAELFVPNPEGKTVVHHIDFDATNNDPVNLLWVTMSEHRAIHNVSKKGSHHTEEAKKKISEANKGRVFTQETRNKISKSNGKPVIQYSINGEFIAKYHSLNEAERQTGIKHESISACCRGKRQTAGGYKWAYLD